MMVVEITILQFQSSSSVDDLPAHFPAQLEIDGNKVAVMLDRLDAPPERPVDRGRFGQAKYALRLPAHGSPTGLAVLSLGNEAGSGYAFSLSGVDASRAQDRPRSAENALAPPEPARPQSAKPERGNAFLGNLSSYAPIYAVYGPGTDSDARLQISFKYQLFGEAGATGRGHPFINNIHIAVTQRMFWDLGTESTPFRNIDFMPELFYLLPATAIDRRIALGGQAGLRHESNGRDGLASRSLNTLYLQPVATMSVGKYTLSLGPRLDLYVGRLKDNPDIKRYRGNASLFAEIGQDDGIRLSTNTRFNFATGKGAIDANLSYPLDRLVYSELNLYAFGQAFAGYGENLLDYNRRITRLRVGVGIVR
ncbi:phospholipase A [Sphingomonas sp. XMGL2]|uniref:Phospholipase A1 n=2 Tax=Sphingomonas quercus TaxID=2842451 RepID=A0ABS6BJH3_9SPHN|nr:phospholipase A [Sphingomonas quercus]